MRFAYDTHLTSRSFGHLLLINGKKEKKERLHQSETKQNQQQLPLIDKEAMLLSDKPRLHSYVCLKRLTTEN